MSKYAQDPDQMWGSYDFVDHSHDSRVDQPSMSGVQARGDYQWGRQGQLAPPGIAWQQRERYAAYGDVAPAVETWTKTAPTPTGSMSSNMPSWGIYAIAAGVILLGIIVASGTKKEKALPAQ